MSSEKESYDEGDNSRVVTPPQTSPMAESGIDCEHEKKIMYVFQCLPFFYQSL